MKIDDEVLEEDPDKEGLNAILHIYETHNDCEWVEYGSFGFFYHIIIPDKIRQDEAINVPSDRNIPAEHLEFLNSKFQIDGTSYMPKFTIKDFIAYILSWSLSDFIGKKEDCYFSQDVPFFPTIDNGKFVRMMADAGLCALDAYHLKFPEQRHTDLYKAVCTFHEELTNTQEFDDLLVTINNHPSYPLAFDELLEKVYEISPPPSAMYESYEQRCDGASDN